MSALRPEVHRRLLFAKYLFTAAEGACRQQADQFAFTKGLLLLHDSADNALGAVADHLNVKLPDNATLPTAVVGIEKDDPEKRAIPYRQKLILLNTIRGNAKHKGFLPDIKESQHLTSAVEEFLRTICREYCGVEFDGLSAKGMLTDKKVVERLDRAEAAMAANEYEEALIELGYAMYHACEVGNVYGRGWLTPGETPPRRWVEPYAVPHAIELMRDGVDLNDYYHLKRLTPRLALTPEGDIVHDWDQHYGHPGNWTRENALFCYRVCVESAMSRQMHREGKPELMDFLTLYEHRVVAVKDEVVVLNWPPSQGLFAFTPPGPSKGIGTLAKGDILTGWATDEPERYDYWFVISDDLKTRTTTGWNHGFVAKADVSVERRDRWTREEVERIKEMKGQETSGSKKPR